MRHTIAFIPIALLLILGFISTAHATPTALQAALEATGVGVLCSTAWEDRVVGERDRVKPMDEINRTLAEITANKDTLHITHLAIEGDVNRPVICVAVKKS